MSNNKKSSFLITMNIRRIYSTYFYHIKHIQTHNSLIFIFEWKVIVWKVIVFYIHAKNYHDYESI